MDKSKVRAYFDGASQGNPQICGAGGIIFLEKSHSLKFRAGLVQGTNNYAELMAFKLHLTLASEKGITNLQIFGDSLLVMKWMRGENVMSKYLLQPLYDEIKGTISEFNLIFFQHVYR